MTACAKERLTVMVGWCAGELELHMCESVISDEDSLCDEFIVCDGSKFMLHVIVCVMVCGVMESILRG